MIKNLFNFIFRDCIIHIINIVTYILPNCYVTTRIRGFLIRPFIGKCGKNFRIASGVIINKPERMEIGDNVYIAHNVWINAVGKLKIGSDSIIGPMSVLSTSKHKFVEGKATNNGEFSTISIGEGTWVASHVVVTDGIKIGNGVLVAAGAVVTHDVQDGMIVGGVPAKEINKKDENYENKESDN